VREIHTTAVPAGRLSSAHAHAIRKSHVVVTDSVAVEPARQRRLSGAARTVTWFAQRSVPPTARARRERGTHRSSTCVVPRVADVRPKKPSKIEREARFSRAERESARFTRGRSLVRSQVRPFRPKSGCPSARHTGFGRFAFDPRARGQHWRLLSNEALRRRRPCAADHVAGNWTA
jgi:hypothetical protein